MGWEHLAPSLDYLLLQCAYRNLVQEFDGEIGREMGMAATRVLSVLFAFHDLLC